MAKVVLPITATVELITGIKEGDYGPYRSVLFKDVQGEKIWKSFDPNSEELEQLTKGTRVQLVPSGQTRSGKPSYQIVMLDTPPREQTLPQSLPIRPGWTPQEKQTIAAAVEQHADLMAYCLQVSKAKFSQLVETEDSIRSLATTLFIQSLRK